MTQLTPEIAEGLRKLLKVIASNTDKYPDWIDAVCTAAEALPHGTTEALAHASAGVSTDTQIA
jgi:hypothetical protein